MGEKYQRTRVLGSGDMWPDSDWAYEVVADKIVTYAIVYKGLLKRNFDYVAKDSFPITRETTVETRTPSSGSGACKISTGKASEDFWIHEKLNEFAAEVQRAIEHAPS